MQVIDDPRTIQQTLLKAKRQGKTVGFVPTMGNLHKGHLSLVELTKEKVDISVVSIFVNPLQFGPNEDFDSYPRTLDVDLQKLEAVGTDLVFVPTINAIYPQGKETHTFVQVPRLTDKLCGASRPNHFQGVTTVVNKLLNIVQPDIAVFGKKDYQQLLVIKAMVDDLMMPINIIGGEIEREKNGLALSSRNGYLTDAELQQASQLRKVLLWASSALKEGTPISAVESQAYQTLQQHGFTVDYFSVVNRSTLEPAINSDCSLLIAAAAWLGKPRLIDNIEVDR